MRVAIVCCLLIVATASTAIEDLLTAEEMRAVLTSRGIEVDEQAIDDQENLQGMLQATIGGIRKTTSNGKPKVNGGSMVVSICTS